MTRAARHVVRLAGCLALGACGLVTQRGAPDSLHGYNLLIEAHDSLSDSLARALKRRGFTVRRRIRGGSPPTAVLVTFTFRELGDSSVLWFNARWADTRTGLIVSAVSAPIDSLGATVAARAVSLADSFAARRSQPFDRSP